MTLASILTRAWLKRGPLACALYPVSLLFRVLAGLRSLLYRAGVWKSSRLPVPVIVVGNIFIGGTGKTPLTIWLVEQLRAAGLKPGVISRGFGSKEAGARPGRASPGRARVVGPQPVTALSTPADVGDEPVLIATRAACPVFVCRDRAQAGRALLAAHPEVNVIVTDDGLQHYALQRDVEVVLFDGRGVGNGWTLPAGPLREPPSRRRDVTVVNAPALTPRLAARVGGHPYRMVLEGDTAERLGDRRDRVPLRYIGGRGRVAAAAGIGNPARFFRMLADAGLVFQELPLPDHHDFLDRPFASVDADVILMTEKDAVKCAQIEELRNDPRLWVVPVSARLDAALADHIVEKCRGRTFA
jgi:tetraacyldisaccharide 4'-kinase